MPNKILTTDNLDVIKEYIYEQDQENGRLYLSKIDEKFDEKLSEVENSLETLYKGVISEVREDLDKLDAQHQSYEAKVDPELEKFNSKTQSIETILNIQKSAGKDFSKRLNTIEDKIESIKSNNSSGNTVLNADEFIKLINSTSFSDQMKPGTSAGKAILQNVENYGKIKAENIIAGDIIGSTIKDKNTSPNWAFNNNGSAQLGGENGITITTEGNIQVGNKFKINFYSNIEGGNSDLLNSIATNVKDKILSEIELSGGIDNATVKNIIDQELLKYNYALEYNTDEEPKYTNITINGNTVSIPVIKLKRLDDIEDALGLVKSSEGGLTKKEFTVIDNTKEQLDINKKVDSIDAVSLRESMDSILETEYKDIIKKVDGRDTDYKILKSKRLDDIENLLYINKTGKDGKVDIPYYNIITAIAGNPRGMPNGEVSQKFEDVSEKGVLDMVFESHEGGLWIPKSRVLDYIKDSIGTWDLGTNSENKNTITKNINNINSNIGLWNNENGTNTIKNAINTNAINISNLDETISKNKKEFDDHTAQQIIDNSILNDKFDNIQAAFNTNNERLADIIGAFASNVKTEELAALLAELLKTDAGVTSTLNELLKDYLKITVADNKYITTNNFKTQIELYEKKTDVDNKITNALKDYTSTANLNLLLTNYITNTTLASTLESYAKNNDVYSQNAANDRFLNKNDFTGYLTNNSNFISLQDNVTNLENNVNNKADNSTVTSLQATVTSLQATITSLQATITSLQARVTALEENKQTNE